MINEIIKELIKILIIVVPLLIATAFITLAERKVLASMQFRTGPNVVGIYGTLQPIADAIKLFAKETTLPNHANIGIFMIAPVACLILSIITWAPIPFGPGLYLSDLNVGILYIFAVSSLSVYAILCSGWASNSKYPFLGALRATAQMISYEVSIGLIILVVVMITGSLNLSKIVLNQAPIWNIFPLFPAAIMFFISALAETFRPPFDLPESESELVSGYNVEYSSMWFSLFFLGEYLHIIAMSFLGSILFLGGWLPPFYFLPVIGPFWLILKVLFLVFLFIWVRSALPRFRYTDLTALCWKSFLPLALGFFLFVAGIFIGMDWAPFNY